MRELSTFEVEQISGGYNNKGYNFSFIIGNTVIMSILGNVFFDLPLQTGAAVGAIYSTAMLVTTYLDYVAFGDDA